MITMIDKIKDLVKDQSIRDGWVSYHCPFCTGRSRPILNILISVGTCTVHCFSTQCKAHGYLRFKLNINQGDLKYALEDKVKDAVHLGSDFSVKLHPLPDKFLRYLAEYYIESFLIRKYRIGYCSEYPIKDRLVIPVDDGYLARSLDKLPKWKNYTGLPFHCLGNGLGELVIVEDPFSAIRVGEFKDSLALLGTSLDKLQLTKCLEYDKIIVWLDPDKAGYQGTLRAIKRLSPYVQVKVLQESNEAKEISDYQLRSILNGV